MMSKFESLKEGDTVDVKFTSKINDICQKKGCWMNVALENDNSAFTFAYCKWVGCKIDWHTNDLQQIMQE